MPEAPERVRIEALTIRMPGTDPAAAARLVRAAVADLATPVGRPSTCVRVRVELPPRATEADVRRLLTERLEAILR